MKKTRLKILLLALISVVSILGGCQKYKEIEVTSVKVETLNVRGLRGADVVLAVGVDNPAGQISVSEIEGEVKHSGKVLGRVAVAPFVLKPKTQETYNIELTLSIAEGASLRDLMMFTDIRKLNECTVDLSAVAKIKGGGKKKLAVKDIPLKELL